MELNSRSTAFTIRSPLKPSHALVEFIRTFILWIYYNIMKAPKMSYIAFLHILSQLVFEV